MGTGTCAFTAPDVFDVDDSGRVVIIGAVTTGDERIREAVAGCPMDALSLIVSD
jgi:ferredoxin